MDAVTSRSVALRSAITRHRGEVDEVLGRYAATDARLVGSVARGDAGQAGDLDLLVDLVPEAGSPLLRVSGIAEELSALLGAEVDVVAVSLLRKEVSASALADAVAV
ncbi:nucleotidyltransferase family protein [Phycicoccus flavus]|uniref:nucleotidyltransferase family protein n=1 Tax=Phycicoccus flavus TaxID=2502783 RepID=UPI000FEBD659|nr:nucleotidyltransferase domain-containing protein [Phycicoccus flavus]NHA66611.1 nucleotidyltransferase [Phycicoccus flavus]